MKKKGKNILNRKRGGGDAAGQPEATAGPIEDAATPKVSKVAKAGVKGAENINQQGLNQLAKLQQVKLYKAGKDSIDEKTLVWGIQALTVLSILNFLLSRDFLKYQKSEAITYIGLSVSLLAAFILILVSIVKEFADKDFSSEIARIFAIVKAVVSRNIMIWFIIPQLMFAIGLTLDNSKFYFAGNFPDLFINWNNLNILGLFAQVYLFLQSMANSISGKPPNKWIIPIILLSGVLTIMSEVMIYVILYLKRVDG